jgi:hypothetical protein
MNQVIPPKQRLHSISLLRSVEHMFPAGISVRFHLSQARIHNDLDALVVPVPTERTYQGASNSLPNRLDLSFDSYRWPYSSPKHIRADEFSRKAVVVGHNNEFGIMCACTQCRWKRTADWQIIRLYLNSLCRLYLNSLCRLFLNSLCRLFLNSLCRLFLNPTPLRFGDASSSL